MTRSIGTFAAATVACMAAASAAQARDFTVVSWGGAYQEAQGTAYFEPYKEEYGPLREESYNGELARIKAMVETGDVTWDVVQFEHPEMLNACFEGLIEPLDWDRLENTEHLSDLAKMGDCGLATIFYSNILAFNTDRIDGEQPQSWADFWNTEKWPGKRGLRRTPKFTFEIALLADGVAPDEIYDVLSSEEGVDRAFAKLDEIKDDIQWWEAGAQPPQWLAAGDVVMTSAYNGRISSAISEGQPFEIVWNGQVFTLDGWGIVSGTDKQEEAYDFLSLANRAETQATLATEIPYGQLNTEVTDLVSPEAKAKLPTNPENQKNQVKVDASFWIDNIEQINERFNNWASR